MKKNVKHALFIGLQCILLYPLIIVGDWLLERSMHESWITVDAFEGTRVTNDILQSLLAAERKLIAEFKADGLIIAKSPSHFEMAPPLKALMSEAEIGAIGAKPNTEVVLPCDEGYGTITYKADRFGLRNNDTKWDDEIDTLFIGDSFTQGECVDSNSVIAEQYDSLADTRSINLASSGNNPKHYATLAELFITRLKPKEVFLIFYENDMGVFDSLIFDLHVLQGKSIFDDTGALYPSDAYIELHNAAQHFDFKHAPEFQPLSLIKRGLHRASLPGIRRVINSVTADLFKDSRLAIDIALSKCKQVQCELLVAYIPASEYWSPNPNPKAVEYIKALKHYTELKNVPFLNASIQIEIGKTSKDYAIRGPHLSPQGYKKVAALLANRNHK